MPRLSFLIPCAAVALVLSAGCTHEAPPVLRVAVGDSLIGTWRMVRFGNDSTASAKSPFGPSSTGYLVYDRTRHVFFQVMRRTAMESLSIGRRQHAPAAEMLKLMDGFEAQFGSYVIDEERRTVTHHLEGELRPRGGSFEVATPFAFSGDSLVLAGAWHFVRVR